MEPCGCCHSSLHFFRKPSCLMLTWRSTLVHLSMRLRFFHGQAVASDSASEVSWFLQAGSRICAISCLTQHSAIKCRQCLLYHAAAC